jgi:YD repeat-containing protein
MALNGKKSGLRFRHLHEWSSSTDPLGRKDSLFYDTADRLTRRVLPGGRQVEFAYDSSGNLTSLTPPGRPAHGFTHTAIDQDSLYTPPSPGAGSWATEYRYNADRQLTEVRRPRDRRWNAEPPPRRTAADRGRAHNQGRGGSSVPRGVKPRLS